MSGVVGCTGTTVIGIRWGLDTQSGCTRKFSLCIVLDVCVGSFEDWLAWMQHVDLLPPKLSPFFFP